MKKIHFFLLFCVCIFLLPPQHGEAQANTGECAGGLPQFARAIRLSPAVCVVFVNNGWPNAIAVLLDANLDTLAVQPTDANGFASLTYNCNLTPFRAATCTPTACCNSVISQGGSLPVKLIDFKAQLRGGNEVILNWTSMLELSSFKYVVQKSIDGTSFSDIGQVNAAGNSDKAISYSSTDKNFTSGIAYYRLKQLDADGGYLYSKVIYVNNRSVGGAITTVYPNPFNSEVQLVGISSSELNSGNIRLFNTMGQTIPYRISGANAIQVDGTIPKGVYYLKVKDQTIKLLKN